MMTYDQKCYDLAASFLRDKETASEEEFKFYADDLAKRLQVTIEEFMEEIGAIE